MFLIAAEVVAKHVSDDDLARGSLYPPLSSVRDVSFEIAIEVSKYAYGKGEYLLYLFIPNFKNIEKIKFSFIHLKSSNRSRILIS